MALVSVLLMLGAVRSEKSCCVFVEEASAPAFEFGAGALDVFVLFGEAEGAADVFGAQAVGARARMARMSW
jgi:hypothetical protein